MNSENASERRRGFIGGRFADFWQAVKTGPSKQMRIWMSIVAIYGAAALVIGFSSGLYHVQPLSLAKLWFLPLTLLLFPCIPEEFVFRAMVIPRDLAGGSWKRSAAYVMISATTFTLWHPLNAMTINPTAQPFFLNPYFLLICFLLGIACSLSYILSKSFWVPVGIHWLTVVVWVFFLGGRNLVLEQ